MRCNQYQKLGRTFRCGKNDRPGKRAELANQCHRLNIRRPKGTKILVDGLPSRVMGKHILGVNGITVMAHGYGLPVSILRITLDS